MADRGAAIDQPALADTDAVIEAEDVGLNADGKTVLRQVFGSPALDNRYSGGKTPIVATVTAAGDTTVHAPASGQAIRLFWISAKPAPDAAAFPLIKVKLGALECYRDWAIQHWEIFEGVADAELIVNLSAVGNIPVSAHIEEFTP